MQPAYLSFSLWLLQSEQLATELAQKLPVAALAGLIGSLSVADVAIAAEVSPPPQAPTQTKTRDAPQSVEFGAKNQQAPAVRNSDALPEGNQWRYSEFINAVQSGKIERVRFSKEGGQLQVNI